MGWTMKKLIPLLMLTLASGCARMVSKETETVLTYQFIDTVVANCPSPDPLTQRGWVAAAVDEYSASDDKDVNELIRQVTATCDAITALRGTPLSETQLTGYMNIVQMAWLTYQMQYQHMAQTERRRRAAFVQNAGRTMMEIQRTDDLDRIRRNQDAGL